MESAFKALAAAWVISSLVRIPFLIWKGGPLLKGMGVYLIRLDGKDWNLKNTLSYGFIEWLPTLLGATYVLLLDFPTSLFGAWTHATIVLGAQLIWLAPVLFRFNDRNLAEIATGVTIDATKKKKNKIEKSYNKKFRRFLNNFSSGLNYLFYVLITSFFIFSFTQILRIPEQNPAYQETVYGGYNLVWENNIYFAMTGVSAPVDVTDFYQYGLKKAYEEFKYYESLKRKMGVKAEYWNKIPHLENPAVRTDKGRELKLDDTQEFYCLLALKPDKARKCKTFADWKIFIEEHKIIWDRYNRVPDMGTIYVTPPQLIDGEASYKNIQLGNLKAVHIVYLAKNGQPDAAIKEWLRYMKLYRMMANDRQTLFFKATILATISRHLLALEKLLTIAPELATKYADDIMEVLNNDKPIYRDPFLLSDDWGLNEPFVGGSIGNVNAVQNDLFQCFQGAKKLAEKPLDEYPYTENIVLCSLHECKSSLERALIYPARMPGSYMANTFYSLFFEGFLKGHELIKSIKAQQVQFRQAQLAIMILSQNIPAAKIDEFIKTVPSNLKNPITNKPFGWDEENQSLFFERPDTGKKIYWHINLSIGSIE